MAEIGDVGKGGRGKVYWLVEAGEPERVILAWQPEGTAWGRARVASPSWPRSYDVVAFEPRGEVQSTGGRTGVVPLPRGTWNILRKYTNATPVAIGKEGIVLQLPEDGRFVYKVYTLIRSGEGEQYADPPITTRGLGDAQLPPWTAPFDVSNHKFDQEMGRHLVGLAVCSPDVWKKVRSGDTVPPFYLKPLFADPELWACPPSK
jgi:hypothetical protein